MSWNFNSPGRIHLNEHGPPGGGQQLIPVIFAITENILRMHVSLEIVFKPTAYSFELPWWWVNPSPLSLNFYLSVTGNFPGHTSLGEYMMIRQWHKPITLQLSPTSWLARILNHRILPPDVHVWSGEQHWGGERGEWRWVFTNTLILFYLSFSP